MKKNIAKLSAASLTALMAVSAAAFPAMAGGTEYHVGICQLVQHVALDAATKGFEDKLKTLVEANGDTVVFDEQNAAGDSATCSTICNTFVSDGVDLILANATPALQAAQASTNEIPILGTSVTDYATALQISDWKGTTGTNISGTSDLPPLDQQAALFTELLPDAKNVGILYCSAEANSKYQSDVITPLLEKEGFTVSEYTFADSNDLQSIANQACSENDAIYVPTDNTVASNAAIIKEASLSAKVPVIAGEEGICSGCGIATLSISYKALGEKTGEMAADVLLNGADVSKMEVEFAPEFVKKYNPELCEKFGITVPDGYVSVAAQAETETEAETEA